MSERRTLIVTGIVVLLIIVLIIGVIFYLFNFIRSRQNPPAATSDIFPKSSATTIVVSPAPDDSSVPFPTTNTTITQTPSPTPAPTVAPTISPTNPNLKVYAGPGFTMPYPKNWGILTCNNSKNFEFDPYNSVDQLNFTCSFAIKPITVIVGPANCSGQTITLGSNKVVKSVRTGSKGSIYRWCVQSNPMLDITHRVAPTTQPGYSKDDFSSQIEQIISNTSFSSGI